MSYETSDPPGPDVAQAGPAGTGDSLVGRDPIEASPWVGGEDRFATRDGRHAEGRATHRALRTGLSVPA
jgi:hypothetical protein